MTDFSVHKPIDPLVISKRVRQIAHKAKKIHSKPEALRKMLSLIDLTSLTGKEKEADIRALCHKAKSLASEEYRIPTVAAICVYPKFIQLVRHELAEEDILVATVAGGFPSGDLSPLEKLQEVREAISLGADEVDMVIHLPKFFKERYAEVQDEISAIKGICKENCLKVIIETGSLGSLENVRKASEIAIQGGADFLKTSTGKIEPAATPEAFLVMLDVIKEYYDNTGIIVGIKAAGGLRQPLQAFLYLSLVYDVLGGLWIDPEYLRFGASQLVDAVVKELK